MYKHKIGIIGIGFVGDAIQYSLIEKQKELNINITLYTYDKYKNIGSFEEVIKSDILYLCLPTLYNTDIGEYDKTAIYDTCDKLVKYNYNGIVIIKSTVEPNTTIDLYGKYNGSLKIIHNPEFLNARSARHDYHNQSHIILGIPKKIEDKPDKADISSKSNTDYLIDKSAYDTVVNMYSLLFPSAKISVISSTESELLKLMANSFYAMKVQIFTEFYLLCNKLKVDYNTVKNTLLLNGWISPMHTIVPGHDGKISYGGACLAKDAKALNSYMDKLDTPHSVLSACVKEQHIMRGDS